MGDWLSCPLITIALPLTRLKAKGLSDSCSLLRLNSMVEFVSRITNEPSGIVRMAFPSPVFRRVRTSLGMSGPSLAAISDMPSLTKTSPLMTDTVANRLSEAKKEEHALGSTSIKRNAMKSSPKRTPFDIDTHRIKSFSFIFPCGGSIGWIIWSDTKPGGR